MVTNIALRYYKSYNRRIQNKESSISYVKGITQGDDIGKRNINHLVQNVYRDSITVEARGQLVMPLV
jgi:hypothetical protein